MIGAFEDCMIRIFEHGSLVHSFEAHEESVMSVCLASDKELVSCGQDGMVKVWDMRKFDSLAVFRVLTALIRRIAKSTMKQGIAWPVITMECSRQVGPMRSSSYSLRCELGQRIEAIRKNDR